MSQKGTHTWDLILRYHRCTSCGYILESREEYEYRLGAYQKDLQCPRCGHSFTATKAAIIRPGPLFGDGDHAEIQWGEKR